ncbi:hypothetical protein F5Y12DRAFT_788668 [Xylaria sp. FL1777]|nr:hypothetical protein F5Y12DRAFT_788668 [Xylaria sp. FL1777]
MCNANNQPMMAPLHPGGTIRFRMDCSHAVQAIKTMDKLDSTIASLSMQVREAFDNHLWAVLPYLSNNTTYCKFALYAGHQLDSIRVSRRERADLNHGLPEWAFDTIDICREESGLQISNEPSLYAAKATVKLSQESEALIEKIERFMPEVAPNLSELVGPVIAARFIAKAGSLVKLATWPACRLQLLGAARASGHAVRNGLHTPKHGPIIYSCEAMQVVPPEHRGKVARLLANKCVLAARHDYFSNDLSAEYGLALRQEVDRKTVELRKTEEMREAIRLRQAAEPQRLVLTESPIL